MEMSEMAKKTQKVKGARRAKAGSARKENVSAPEALNIAKATRISFDYIKSTQFRVVRVDGVHGGIAPNANTIQMALFSERAPIPKRETFKLKQGRLGDIITREQRDAIIREVEIEALMDLSTAKRVANWLNEKIHAAEELQKEIEEL